MYGMERKTRGEYRGDGFVPVLLHKVAQKVVGVASIVTDPCGSSGIDYRVGNVLRFEICWCGLRRDEKSLASALCHGYR